MAIAPGGSRRSNEWDPRSPEAGLRTLRRRRQILMLQRFLMQSCLKYTPASASIRCRPLPSRADVWGQEDSSEYFSAPAPVAHGSVDTATVSQLHSEAGASASGSPQAAFWNAPSPIRRGGRVNDSEHSCLRGVEDIGIFRWLQRASGTVFSCTSARSVGPQRTAERPEFVPGTEEAPHPHCAPPRDGSVPSFGLQRWDFRPCTSKGQNEMLVLPAVPPWQGDRR